MEERLAWRETRTCGILGWAEDLTDFIFCPRLQLSLGLPALQENFHNFQKVDQASKECILHCSFICVFAGALSSRLVCECLMKADNWSPPLQMKAMLGGCAVGGEMARHDSCFPSNNPDPTFPLSGAPHKTSHLPHSLLADKLCIQSCLSPFHFLHPKVFA